MYPGTLVEDRSLQKATVPSNVCTTSDGSEHFLYVHCPGEMTQGLHVLLCMCRYRELLLFMVAPVSLAMFFWFTVIQQIGAPEALLPQRAIAAYWSSHGELATSAMRPFTQHMRLRHYVIYCLLDAAIMVWVFGKVYGVSAAAVRWGFACGLSVALEWGLDLHMRRGFVGRGTTG